MTEPEYKPTLLDKLAVALLAATLAGAVWFGMKVTHWLNGGAW